MAMASDPNYIHLMLFLKEALHNWSLLVTHMKNTPTSTQQLVRGYLSYIGYSNACHLGTGGVWTTGMDNLAPGVWQTECPEEVKHRINTQTNQSGDIYINNLELEGLVLGWLTIE
eukprot:848908-Ditylum_brightwellii.AAC.2